MGNIFGCCRRSATPQHDQELHEAKPSTTAATEPSKPQQQQAAPAAATSAAAAEPKGNKEPEHFHDNDELAAEANKIRDEARRLRDEAHKPENKEQKGNLLDRANAEDARASQLIFDRLNAPGRHPDGTYDLHLQFVAEAVRIAEESEQKTRAKGINKLVLIVGKGNHSEGGKPKIQPAIVEWAQKKSLKYTEEEGKIVIDL